MRYIALVTLAAALMLPAQGGRIVPRPKSVSLVYRCDLLSGSSVLESDLGCVQGVAIRNARPITKFA